MDRVPVRLVGERAHVEPDPRGDLAELAVHVLPLADPQVVEVLGLAHLAELARAAGLLLLAEVAPQVEVG